MEPINPTLVIQQRLASGMGLDKYKLIEDQVHQVDVSADADFQRRACEKISVKVAKDSLL